MIPLRSGQQITQGGPPPPQTVGTTGPPHSSLGPMAQADFAIQQQQLKKAGGGSSQKQRTGPVGVHGINGQAAGFIMIPGGSHNQTAAIGGGSGGISSQSAQRQHEVGGGAIQNQHHQTAKIPHHQLNGATSNSIYQKGMITGASTLQAPSSLSMNSTTTGGGGGLVDKSNSHLTASQKKRISLKKLEEEYSKTIEQIGSPNSATINLENMKKTQSLHYVRGGGSGASSPQQIKSRTSIGKYGANGQNPVSMSGVGMAIYNNYNQVIGTGQQRNSYVSKSQMGGAPAVQQTGIGMNGISGTGSALGTVNRSRSKITNRKKRNLYTSVGNYYQSQQPSNITSAGQAAGGNGNNSASRVTKRVYQQNFLDNLEQTNMLIGGNLVAAHHFLHSGDEQGANPLQKKRNKSSTKSYNNNNASSNINKDFLEQHNNSSEICYSSHLTKKNPMQNNFFDVSQFSGNHNSIAKGFENSFQGFSGGFLPNSNKVSGQNNSSLGGPSLSALSSSKQRPASTHKSALMAAAAAIGGSSNNSSAKITGKKKGTGGSSGLRKSVNNVSHAIGGVSGSSSSNPMNQSANYGNLQQNAYDFLTNASLFMNTGKAARRPNKAGGGNSALDSRCSQTKDHQLSHTNGGGGGHLTGFAKSQVASNTAFGHHQQQPLNNTSHTTICSNRKQGIASHLLPGDIVSGKKNSLQQQNLHQQNYINLVGAGGHHNSDMLTAGEISSDRQTLKMNDFLKQIEAYSNDKLDKFMPSVSQTSNSNLHSQPTPQVMQQVKIAEQVKNLIDREMQILTMIRGNSSKQQRYQQNDESREVNESGTDINNEGADDDQDDLDEGQQQPDYEHLLNVISDSFNSLIATFYQSGSTAIIGVSLARIKESYEEIINSIVENLSQQIESLQGDNDSLFQENNGLRDQNQHLEKMVASSNHHNQQVASFVKQNEALGEELRRLLDENQALKKDQKDRDSQLNESKKLIEKLSASQKQLLTNQSNIHHNTSGSSQLVAAKHNQGAKGGVISGKLSSSSVPPLDLGRLGKVQQPQHNQPPGFNPLQMLSNDSMQTLDKALLNANLQEHSSTSSVREDAPHHNNGGRILDELYRSNAPFQANQSDISYQNSDEEEEEEERERQQNRRGQQTHQLGRGVGPVSNQSGRLSSIAQDKSPIMKPFIPLLNLNTLNNLTQGAREGASNQGGPPVQSQQQQAPPQMQMKNAPKFKLDLSNVNTNQSNTNKILDQDSSSALAVGDGNKKGAQLLSSGGLGLNLGGLKQQQKGIVDFQDEFMAKQDEFSESWRNALKREKRF